VSWKDRYMADYFPAWKLNPWGPDSRTQSCPFLKLLVVGNSGAGKTAFLLRLVENNFHEGFPTIGVDFKLAMLVTETELFKLQVWDTTGQACFRTITPTFYRGAHGVFIMFDIADAISFSVVRHLHKEARRYGPAKQGLVLVGLKTDLDSHRQVSSADARALAEELNMRYLECSSRTGIGVQRAGFVLAKEALPLAKAMAAAPPPKRQPNRGLCSLQ